VVSVMQATTNMCNSRAAVPWVGAPGQNTAYLEIFGR